MAAEEGPVLQNRESEASQDWPLLCYGRPYEEEAARVYEPHASRPSAAQTKPARPCSTVARPSAAQAEPARPCSAMGDERHIRDESGAYGPHGASWQVACGTLWETHDGRCG